MIDIFTNNIMIFTKTDDKGKTHYRAGISSKNLKGDYESAYIDIKMPKDTKIENKTRINITKGFLSFYNYEGKDNRNHTIWYIVVQEYNNEDKITKVESIDSEDLDMPLPF